MRETSNDYVDIQQLRLGLFVHLDLGWMAHPFPMSSFKISSQKQIDTIRSLGLSRVRISREKSDPDPVPAATPVAVESPAASSAEAPAAAPVALTQQERLLQQRREQVAREQRSLLECEQRFGAATRGFDAVMAQVAQRPELARDQGMALVGGLSGEMLEQEQSLIRLLSEGSGDRASLHAVNVTVISLLLGKALGLSGDQMTDLGMAALLHDVGKTMLPDRVRWREENFTPADAKLYRDHVGHSVAMARRMGLAQGVLDGIAQHHEFADGSGFPLGLTGDRMAVTAQIIALVNQYDDLCNPGNPTGALTPHEALALIFAQMKPRFEARTLATFIRMMGVYPPGSVVQLVDERYAIVVSVNAGRPLRPRLIVHDPAVPKEEALIVNLEMQPELGIRRSLKPMHLPKATMDYLSPRKRICYFFDRALDPASQGELA